MYARFDRDAGFDEDMSMFGLLSEFKSAISLDAFTAAACARGSLESRLLKNWEPLCASRDRPATTSCAPTPFPESDDTMTVTAAPGREAAFLWKCDGE